MIGCPKGRRKKRKDITVCHRFLSEYYNTTTFLKSRCRWQRSVNSDAAWSFLTIVFSLVHIPITIIYILFLCRPSLVYLLYYFRKINGWNSGQIVRNKYYFLAQLDLCIPMLRALLAGYKFYSNRPTLRGSLRQPGNCVNFQHVLGHYFRLVLPVLTIPAC